MITSIKKKTPIMNINNDSELKQVQGQYANLSVHKKKDGEIIIRDCQDVFIPKSYRQELINELHSTHLLDWSMLILARGH